MDITHPRPQQRGVAALVVVTLLFLAMTLVVVFTNKTLLVELRMAGNQYRSTQALEAAEAGLEWALARLNDSGRLNAACQPTAEVSALSFRDRHLLVDDSTGVFTPATWDDAGMARPLLAACVRGDSGWTCSCPANGLPALAASASGRTAPAFSLELAAGARPGIVRAISTGCTRSTGVCGPTSDAAHEASARVEVALALVPGLRAAPAAALTARGGVDVGNAGLGLHNREPATGLALHAGGSVVASMLHVTVPPGSPAGGSVVSNDTVLAGLGDERFFAQYFGMDGAAWSAQPTVARIACAGNCADDIARAVAAGASLVAIDGDLGLAGPVTLGTAARPVAIVASGAARLSGAVTVHGLLFARGIAWRDASAPAALIRGAVVSAADYAGNAAADLDYDTVILERLKRTTGSFARVNGSWKDF